MDEDIKIEIENMRNEVRIDFMEPDKNDIKLIGIDLARCDEDMY